MLQNMISYFTKVLPQNTGPTRPSRRLHSPRTVVTGLSLVFLLTSACSGGGSQTDKTDTGGDSTSDFAPVISQVYPEDGQTGLAEDTEIRVVFENPVLPESVSALAQNGDCTGSLQVSANNFSTCVGGELTNQEGLKFVFQPGAPLNSDTTYKIRVLTSVTSPGGKPLAEAFEQNQGFSVQDYTPPALFSILPAAGSTAVSLNTKITVTFDEAMDPDSLLPAGATHTCVSGSAIQLIDYNTFQCVPASFSGSGQVFTLTPLNLLNPNQNYFVRVLDSAADLAGNTLENFYEQLPFETGSTSDNTPPEITPGNISPTDGETDVLISAAITLDFSENLDTGTLSVQAADGACSGSIQLSADSFSTCVGLTLDTSSNPQIVATPQNDLQTNTVYKLKIKNTVTDQAGNALAATYTMSTGFQTVNVVDGTAPQVSSTSPTDAATGVNVKTLQFDSPITVTFDENMAPASATMQPDFGALCTGSVWVSSNDFGSCVNGSVSVSGSDLVITPGYYLNYNTTYKVRVRTGVTDVAGNGLDANYTFEFTTAACVQSFNRGYGTCPLSVTGAVTHVAGKQTGTEPFWYDDGTGTAAGFYTPKGSTVAKIGGTKYMYVSDPSNHNIRQINLSTMAVTTLAGPDPATCDANSEDCPNGAIGSYIPGCQGANEYNETACTGGGGTWTETTTAGSTRFGAPTAMATDGTWLYVVDEGSSAILKINLSTGDVSHLAGNGSGYTNGDAKNAKMGPQGLALDENGDYLYFSDISNTIRRLDLSTLQVETIAGPAAPNVTSGFNDGDGADALFYDPRGIVTDGNYLFVADYGNHRIRQINLRDPAFPVTTIAGNAVDKATDYEQARQDGQGLSAGIYNPGQLTWDGRSLYISHSSDHRIRKLFLPSRNVTLVAGPAAADCNAGAGTSCPNDTSGVQFPTPGDFDPNDGTGTAARFFDPWGIVNDGTQLFAVERSGRVIREIQ